MTPPCPNFAHGDRVISAKLRRYRDPHMVGSGVCRDRFRRGGRRNGWSITCTASTNGHFEFSRSMRMKVRAGDVQRQSPPRSAICEHEAER